MQEQYAKAAAAAELKKMKGIRQAAQKYRVIFMHNDGIFWRFKSFFNSIGISAYCTISAM